MKIGFYSPYLDSFGGGERYLFTLAGHWSRRHHVDIFWDDKNIVNESQKRLNLDLSRLGVVPNVFATNNILKKAVVSRLYDVMFFLSDGSIPATFARANILHFQVPFPRVSVSGWKSSRYQCIVCNSEFTKSHLDPQLPIPARVIYPPVDTEKFHAGRKTNTILSVGRFNAHYTAKKFDVLINAFRHMYFHKQLPGWKLILAGGLLRGDNDYYSQLKLKSKGLPIELYPNAPFVRLKTLYEHATIYWHAAGFGETDPQHMEHFGITTVEAMAAGCIPIVFAGGGQTEIVTNGANGYLWKTVEELTERTRLVIGKQTDNTLMKRAAMSTPEKFSKLQFFESFDNLLTELTGEQL